MSLVAGSFSSAEDSKNLSPGDSAGVFKEEDFRQAKLRAKVESMGGARVRIRLSGEERAEGLYGGEKERPYAATASADGIAVSDVEKKEMQSLLIVFQGKAAYGRMSDPAGPGCS